MDFGDGGTSQYQTSGHDSPIIFPKQVYVVVTKNCTVLEWWPSNRVWVDKNGSKFLKILQFLTPCEI